MQLDSDKIKEILPHRPPFLFIDRVTDCQPGEWAKAIKLVSANEEFFVGHFPAKAIMPGVLIIEALAQTAGIALLAHGEAAERIPESDDQVLAVLAGVDSAKFRIPVIPGDVLELEGRIMRRKANMGVADCVAKVEGKTVCTATLTFALTKFTKT